MIAFIGDARSVKPYKLFGFSTYTAENTEEAEKALKEIASSSAEAVFMTEKIFEAARGIAKELGIHAVAVPGAEGSRGTGGEYIRETLRKALGTDI